MMKRRWLVVLVIFGVLLVDQCSKFWVKLNMMSDDEFFIFGSWSRIHFIENPGMAFGMEFGGNYGKLMLTIFRIIAVFVLIYIIRNQIKIKAHTGFLVALSFILAGAMGNIIDSIFYGVIFSHSDGQLATLFPPEGGYGTLFHGKVVDMLYFPMVSTTWPEWIPYFGGRHLSFFDPIFNVADAAISTGVVIILLFQKKFFKDEETGGSHVVSEA